LKQNFRKKKKVEKEKVIFNEEIWKKIQPQKKKKKFKIPPSLDEYISNQIHKAN
jgi:hypothetical protein